MQEEEHLWLTHGYSYIVATACMRYMAYCKVYYKSRLHKLQTKLLNTVNTKNKAQCIPLSLQ